jgi:enamine deaminase RidA (YjgF/YER057c/UK114 family)
VSGRKSPQQGKAGIDINADQAKLAAQAALLDILSIIKLDIGDLDKIKQIVSMRGFVNSAEDFIQQPQVIDGASELLIELFGEPERHARTATGAAQLPYGATVQLDLIVELFDSE